jgi:hypothetical protein
LALPPPAWALSRNDSRSLIALCDGDPFPPDACCCGIGHYWLSDAVLTPHGFSFSRREIEDWLVQNPICPFTRQPLTTGELIPNRKLQEAVDYYRCNHQRLFAALRG